MGCQHPACQGSCSSMCKTLGSHPLFPLKVFSFPSGELSRWGTVPDATRCPHVLHQCLWQRTWLLSSPLPPTAPACGTGHPKKRDSCSTERNLFPTKLYSVVKQRICSQTERLREGFKAVRTYRQANPLRAFPAAAAGMGRGKRWRHWARFPRKAGKEAEPRLAIKHESRAQEVTSAVGALVLASPLSLCLRPDYLEVALAEANAGLIKSCSGPGCPRPIAEAHTVSSSYVV